MRKARLIIALCITILLSVIIPATTSAHVEELPAKATQLFPVDIPAPLHDVLISERNHISRIRDEETELNSAIFENKDGSRTLYIFGEKIKYIAMDGKIKDKSNRLAEFDSGYQTLNNDIHTVFPLRLHDGVTLTYGDYAITVTPMNTNKNVVGKLNAETGPVNYVGAFGHSTILSYTPELSGYKEEISIQHRTEGLTFVFDVETKGLKIAESNGSLALFDPVTQEKIACLSPLLMWDSAGKQAVGDYNLAESDSCGHYVIKYEVDAFLNHPETVYPVTIDPSIIVGQGSSTAIEDATIFTNYNSNWGTWISLFVGNFDTWTMSSSDYRGKARTLVKFPALMNNSTFNSLYNAGVVSSVKYNFADTWCLSGPNTINAYLCTSAWNESTAVYSNYLWNSLGTYVGNTTISPLDPVPITKPRYEIDITLAVNKWKSGTQNNGIMLKANNESLTAVCIGSSEVGNPSGSTISKPYVVVNYNPVPNTTSGTIQINDNTIYRLKNVGSGKYMSVHNGFDGNSINVYQKNGELVGSYYHSQNFIVKYDTTEYACRIHPVCSMYGRRRVLDVVKSAAGVQGLTHGCNLQTFNPTDDIAQLFNIVPVGNGYYKIVLKYNTSLAITAYGTGNGSSGGTSSTSTGNIFMATYTGDSSQKWLFEPTVINDEKRYYGAMNLAYPFRGSSIPVRISSGYGYRVGPINGGIEFHAGIDIPADSGEILRSAMTGTIEKIGYEPNTSSGRGHYIIVMGTNDFNNVYDSTTKIGYVYMHLLEAPYVTTPTLFEGMIVFEQVIMGKVGSTGASTGPHLHYGIIIDGGLSTGEGHVTNPIAFYPGIQFTY